MPRQPQSQYSSPWPSCIAPITQFELLVQEIYNKTKTLFKFNCDAASSPSLMENRCAVSGSSSPNQHHSPRHREEKEGGPNESSSSSTFSNHPAMEIFTCDTCKTRGKGALYGHLESKFYVVNMELLCEAAEARDLIVTVYKHSAFHDKLIQHNLVDQFPLLTP